MHIVATNAPEGYDRDVAPAFLLSLPRSGSTLLQRLLGSHSAISTQSEPWILLPSLYALKKEGTYAEYSHRTSSAALRAFCGVLPEGEEDYLKELRHFVMSLYAKASTPGSRYFLDKTPRYCLIVDEIQRLFPDAPMLVLWRNPLSVIASLVDTWFSGRWAPYHHKVDLFVGVDRLLDAVQRRPSDFLTMRYEDLVTSPETELNRALTYLGLSFEPALLTEFTDVRLQGPVGDRTGAHSYNQLSHDPLYKWRSTLASPIRKRWCHRYLRWLGTDRLALMGYDLSRLIEELESTPTTKSTLLQDAASTVKGAVWSAFEVPAARDKVARLPQWHRIHSHP